MRSRNFHRSMLYEASLAEVKKLIREILLMSDKRNIDFRKSTMHDWPATI